MNTRLQALLLVAVIAIPAFLGQRLVAKDRVKSSAELATVFATSTSPSLGDAALLKAEPVFVKNVPVRNWKVLDPATSAKAVIIQSLDDQFPFYHYNTYAAWPTASLAKILTAAVVLENVPLSKKVEITERAIATEGVSGELKSGEVYSAEDLLRIMLLTSSNDAAIAFEDLLGGQDAFVKLMNKKAGELKMNQSLFYDAAGLSDLNQTTANDILLLLRYAMESHPEILKWTRSPSVLIQPINYYESRLVSNINPLVYNDVFLGGKTGTSEEAGENLAAIFAFNNQRIAVIILGSNNRVREVETLLQWIREAYSL